MWVKYTVQKCCRWFSIKKSLNQHWSWKPWWQFKLIFSTKLTPKHENDNIYASLDKRNQHVKKDVVSCHWKFLQEQQMWSLSLFSFILMWLIKKEEIVWIDSKNKVWTKNIKQYKLGIFCKKRKNKSVQRIVHMLWKMDR